MSPGTGRPKESIEEQPVDGDVRTHKNICQLSLLFFMDMVRGNPKTSYSRDIKDH